MKTKVEFQTKECLINSLTLDGRTKLIEYAEGLGVDLECYVENVLFQNSTDSFWIDSDLVKVRKKVSELPLHKGRGFQRW